MFGENISQSDITYSKEGSDLVIRVLDGMHKSIGSIKIENALDSTSYQLEELYFADGSKLNWSNILHEATMSVEVSTESSLNINLGFEQLMQAMAGMDDHSDSDAIAMEQSRFLINSYID